MHQHHQRLVLLDLLRQERDRLLFVQRQQEEQALRQELMFLRAQQQALCGAGAPPSGAVPAAQQHPWAPVAPVATHLDLPRPGAYTPAPGPTVAAPVAPLLAAASGSWPAAPAFPTAAAAHPSALSLPVAAPPAPTDPMLAALHAEHAKRAGLEARLVVMETLLRTKVAEEVGAFL